MPTTPQLFVATPCYGGLVTHRYLHGVLQLLMHGVARQMPVFVETLANESLISRGRNTLVAKFLDHPTATHLLFVDADIGFAPAQVARMLAFDADIAAGMYPLKTLAWDEPAIARARAGEAVPTAPLRYVGTLCPEGVLRRRDGFATALYAGTGFMLIRRAALLRMAEAFPELRYSASHASNETPSPNLHAFFDCAIDPHTRHYLSEDFTFCQRWRTLGGDIWLDLQSSLTHTGTYEFVGQPALRFAA